MTPHLTERELIEYRFKLASEAQSEEIAAHLADCTDCRAALEQLKSRFTALDVLREEVTVSEDLISRVLEQTGKLKQTRLVPLWRPAWIGAAAAVLLIASLLLISQFPREKTQKPGFAADTSTPTDFPKPPDSVKPVAVNGDLAPEAGVYGNGIASRSQVAEKAKLGEEKIPEEPPFAPASAIELVTLPRREGVQLTIYNSTVQNLPFPAGYGGYGGRGGYGGGPYGGRYVNVDKSAVIEIPKQMRRRLPPQPPRVIQGSDLTLVRDRRNLTLKKGWNWLQFMWANTLIDPTSLHLEPLEQKGQIDIQQLVFPARLRELGRWLIRSEVGGQVPFEITYFTSGLSWRAFYMGTLSADEQRMDLKGYVRLANNSGEDYESAQTRLIVGQVHILDQIAELARRRYPYGMPGLPAPDDAERGGGYGGAGYNWTNGRVQGYGYGGYGGGIYFSDVLRPKEIRKEGLSEYFLYTIEGRETIPDKWGKRLLSFDVNDIDVNSLYKYDEDRYGRQTIRFISFANDDEHNLGQTPIPNGNVKIYGLADEQGYLFYVGGTGIKYIPVDEEVELNLGPARLVTVGPTLMDFQTSNYVFDRKKNIAGWDEIRTWKMEVMNTRTLPVEIEITRGFGTAYWSLKADIGYEKYDVTQARFELTVQPRTKRTFNYTVTTYHGVREEAITE